MVVSEMGLCGMIELTRRCGQRCPIRCWPTTWAPPSTGTDAWRSSSWAEKWEVNRHQKASLKHEHSSFSHGFTYLTWFKPFLNSSSRVLAEAEFWVCCAGGKNRPGGERIGLGQVSKLAANQQNLAIFVLNHPIFRYRARRIPHHRYSCV